LARLGELKLPLLLHNLQKQNMKGFCPKGTCAISLVEQFGFDVHCPFYELEQFNHKPKGSALGRFAGNLNRVGFGLAVVREGQLEGEGVHV
jgi:hypothetical protein